MFNVYSLKRVSALTLFISIQARFVSHALCSPDLFHPVHSGANGSKYSFQNLCFTLSQYLKLGRVLSFL